MGLGLFKISKSTYDNIVEQISTPLPNPNPENFKIIFHHKHRGYLIVKVNYPDCKNYEGNKIMVYNNVTLSALKKQKSIDPHFSNNDTMYSPIARFEPTDRGLAMALIFVRAWDNERLIY